MAAIKEHLKSPHIQISLATGSCILIMACFSKWVLPEPIGYLPLAKPPFIATIFESILSRHKNTKILKTWYWIIAIFLATAIVILSYMI